MKQIAQSNLTWERAALAALRVFTQRSLGLPLDISEATKIEDAWTRSDLGVKTVQIAERFLDLKFSPQVTQRIMSTVAASATTPTEFWLEILVHAELTGRARRLCRNVNFTKQQLDLSSIPTTVVGGWINSGVNLPAEDLVFGKDPILPGKLGVILPWTREVVEDAVPALLATALEAVGRAFGSHEDAAVWVGDGTATYGGITGMLNASTNILTLSTGKTSFASATLDDFRALRDLVPAGKRDGAVFMVSPTTLSNLQGAKDLQGRNILSMDGPDVWLWNHRVESIPALEALASGPGVKFACFGNPQQMLFAIRREMNLEPMRVGVLGSEGTLVAVNALQADLLLTLITERVGAVLSDKNAIAVMQTAAA